jgi:adenylosuccinate synthase
MKKVDLIVDMQYGSTGKGLIAGYLAERHGYDTVINANMPNAGHTYINKAGRKWIHKVLPNGIVSPNLKRVMIGAGAVFSPMQLRKEIENSKDLLEGVRIMIHPNAVPLTDEHVTNDQDVSKRIGGTGQGSGGALQAKVNRTALVAKDYQMWFNNYVVTHDEWNQALIDSDKILAEGAQGFSLGVSERFYPYCTSRDCTPARFLADMSIPVQMLNDVIGVVRTYPIRTGGNSGGFYSDQVETSWDELNLDPEFTTVTKKERRVFTFSKKQIEDAVFGIRPTKIFLNFCNYNTDEEVGELVSFINSVAGNYGGRVRYLGHGATSRHIETL